MKRLLIVHRSPGFGKAVEEHLAGAYLVHCLFDGQQALEELSSFRPHLLLIHTALPRKDGLTVLEQTSFLPERIVVTTDYLDAFVTARAHALGAREVLLMPMASAAALVVTRLMEQGEVFSLPVWLQSLGFRSCITGYPLLLQAAESLKKDPRQTLSGAVYPLLGPPQAVEKAIRTAIHTAWRKGERQVWNKYFPKDRCPGNKAFFAAVLQLYRDEAADIHGTLCDGAVHRQHLHTGSGGFP